MYWKSVAVEVFCKSRERWNIYLFLSYTCLSMYFARAESWYSKSVALDPKFGYYFNDLLNALTVLDY